VAFCAATWTTDPTRRCGADALDDGSDRCLAHHPERSELLAAIERTTPDTHVRVHLQRTEIDPALLETLLHIAADRDRLTGDGELELLCAGATFTGDTRITSPPVSTSWSFGGCSFLRAADFSGIVCRGLADFSAATFAGPTTFQGTTFAEPAQFTTAQFDADANFCGCTFRRRADFTAVHIAGLAQFDDATFFAGRFDRAEFVSESSFVGTTWARLDNDAVTFPGTCTFVGARFAAKTTFRNATFPCRGTDFTGAVFEAQASFEGATWPPDERRPRAKLLHPTQPNGFDRARFAGKAWFINLTVHNRISYIETTFERDVDFSGTDSDTEWLFERTSFGPSLTVPSLPAGAATILAEATWSTPASIHLANSALRLEGCDVDKPLTVTSRFDQATERRLAAQRRRRNDADRAHVDDGEAALAKLDAFIDCTVRSMVSIVGVDLTTTTFRRSSGLYQLRFTAVDWSTGGRPPRRIIADELPDAGIPDDELEDLYRQLRVGLEASKAAPAAADFYYGELEARRRQAQAGRRRGGPDHVDWYVLNAYRYLGGYGVRAMPPLLSFVAVVLATTVLLRVGTGLFVRDSFDGTIEGYRLDTLWGALAFVLRNSISLFSAPADGLTPGGAIMLIAERFAAVTLLALAVFAVRSRVAR
jgi:hypothetical protein